LPSHLLKDAGRFPFLHLDWLSFPVRLFLSYLDLFFSYLDLFLSYLVLFFSYLGLFLSYLDLFFFCLLLFLSYLSQHAPQVPLSFLFSPSLPAPAIAICFGVLLRPKYVYGVIGTQSFVPESC